MADVFVDESSPDERRFGRLRELCSQPAWTVKGAAWIICGFDSEGYRKGDYSNGESDGWLLLPGVTRERREPEPRGLPEEDLRQLRWERFQERCDTDEARHSRIGMTALRLAGLLNGGMQSAHLPRVILEKAVAAGMAPEWLDYARADPELAGLLPNGSTSRPLATAETRLLTGPSRKRQKQQPWPTPDPVLIARWPKLYASMGKGWEAGAWTSLQSARDRYPCWAHALVSAFYYRERTDSLIAADLMQEPGLLLEENTSFSRATVAQWRKRYFTEEKIAKRLLAFRVLQWRLLDLQERPAPLSPDIDAFLLDAEHSA